MIKLFVPGPVDTWSGEGGPISIQIGLNAPSRIAREFGIPLPEVRNVVGDGLRAAVDHMTIMERLAELERQHKALDHEIAEALKQSAIDDLKITELKRRKLMLKDEIERLRHDHAL
jgi:hypothetical protein